MRNLLRKVSFWNTPTTRLTALFLWWGTFYSAVYLDLTSGRGCHDIPPVLTVLEWFSGAFLLFVYLTGLAFRPLRGFRIALWWLSLAMIGLWTYMPCIVSNPWLEYWKYYVLIIGNWWLHCACFAQLTATVMHTVREWRGSKGSIRDRLYRSNAAGALLALLSLAVTVCVIACSNLDK